MSSKELYKQCKFIRNEGNREERYTTSWIPKKFAKIGNVCELFIKDSLEDGWKIIEVGETCISGMEVREKSRANKDFTKSIK